MDYCSARDERVKVADRRALRPKLVGKAPVFFADRNRQLEKLEVFQSRLDHLQLPSPASDRVGSLE